MPSKKKQTSIYQVWSQIKQRCFNKNCPKFKNYGGRGIDMDPRWRESFATFEKELPPKPLLEGRYSLGRIDNNKGYWPGNVRWETAFQQMRNTRANHMILHEGKMKSIAQVGEETGIPRKLLQKRLVNSKLDVETATTRPIQRGHYYITWNGEELPLYRWAQRLKMPYQTLHSRIVKMKWPVEKAFTVPVNSWSK